jgi:hypothetical protein
MPTPGLEVLGEVGLARSAVAASKMSNHAEAVLRKEKLAVPRRRRSAASHART